MKKIAETKNNTEKLTGYPHIDKPWLKYYDEEFLKKPLPKMGIYEYMKSNNVNNIEKTAISYFGNEISYGQLYENVDTASRVLTALGVRENDRILYILPNIPETAYLMYGGAQIGAISDYVDPRPDSVDKKISAQKILNLFKEEKAKYIIALDQCYLAMLKPIEKELQELGLNSIVIISARDSMNLLSTINYMSEIVKFNSFRKLKEKINYNKKIQEMIKLARNNSCIKIIDYKELVKECKYNSFSPIEYKPNKVDLIVHTSGTSSPKPKPIPLTNDNLNSYVHQTYGGNMTMEVGDRALHMLPYFAAYGVVDVTHAGLCHGNNLIQIPEFSPINFGKLILKYKPQTIIGAPTWFLNLVNDSSVRNKDLSFLKMITFGGDSMEIKDEEKINEFLKNHNCKSKITKGHGMSETCGCSSYAINEYNIPGTIGIPMPNTTYAVINPETRELINFEDGKDEIEGELIISSPTITQGILDDKVIVPHINYNGMDFIFTRDIAKMNRDGLMSFLSRSDRSFTRFDGFKVKPYEIENILKKNEQIKYCVISPYFDDSKFGNMTMATIVLENQVEKSSKEKVEFVKKIINDYFVKNPNVSTRQIPTKFKFKTKLPITSNGKVDFKALINEGITGDEITVELEETNISIGEINVIPATKVEKE